MTEEQVSEFKEAFSLFVSSTPHPFSFTPPFAGLTSFLKQDKDGDGMLSQNPHWI